MIPARPQYEGLNITFNVTEDCNLRCSYCYELDTKPKDLPLDYAKRFIDILLADPNPIASDTPETDFLLNTGLCIDLIGGDALMRPELCTDILRYFMFAASGHKWGFRWRSSISTNGTLFGDPKVRDFLEEFGKNICLGVSVDGCPEIHNVNRNNSMDAILKYWDWYVSFCKRTYSEPSTKSTLNRLSIPYLYKSLRFLHEDLGLRYINQNFIFEPMGDTADDHAELDRQMEKCIEYVYEHRDDLYWSMIDKNFSCAPADPDRGWCGAGAMPALGVNGKIYPCFRFLPHTMSDRSLDFYVGDVWNGLTHKERFRIVRDQTRERISPQKCKDCDSHVEAGCAWCIGGAFSEKGVFYRQTNICEIHKIQQKWTDEYWRRYGSDDG